jgi:hypothetical protein
MQAFDEQSVLAAGGWPSEFAVTLVVAWCGAIAGALIDTNGDGVDINLDRYECDADGWHEVGSGSASDSGTSWSPRMVAAWGRDEPGSTIQIDYAGGRYATAARATGWWLFVAPVAGDSEELPRAPR